MSKEIPLTKGKVAIVDDDDFESLSRYRWHYGGTGYAVRSIARKSQTVHVRMHREIMNPPDGMEIDHINGDKLDNRRANLRICTRTENQCNCGVQSNNTSGFRGVSWHKRKGKWCAKITMNGKRRNLGYHLTPESAAAAYNKAAREIHGSFAWLNKE